MTNRAKTPVVLLTGVDPDAMATVLVSLAWDLPRAVSVHHSIDPDAQTLTRVVSDAGGVLETEVIQLAHACTSCALREDIVPTIARLAMDGRWDSVLACLPVGAEAGQVGTVVAGSPALQRRLRIAAVVAALAGPSIVADLLDREPLMEHGRHCGPDDDRGHGEVACALVEYADVVAVTTELTPSDTAVHLVRALARPDATVVVGTEKLRPQALLAGVHDFHRTSAWFNQVLMTGIPGISSGGVWRIVLDSARPFHPERLLDRIDLLGSGRHRSRGAFWLPTRPGIVQEWGGAGGQLSLGSSRRWGALTPRTRLLFTGIGAVPASLERSFEEILVQPEEGLIRTPSWSGPEDGFEAWLGPIRDAA